MVEKPEEGEVDKGWKLPAPPMEVLMYLCFLLERREDLLEV